MAVHGLEKLGVFLKKKIIGKIGFNWNGNGVYEGYGQCRRITK